MMKISDQLSLPLDAITSTFGIFAMRGVGKTHTASVMVEEMLKAGQPACVYDPTGAWYGLKSSADGKRPGFPVVVFGGEHPDVPLEETAGETIARVVVERRCPAILDCGLMKKGARVRFMADFCETLYRLNREPLHLVLDEVHTIAPREVRGTNPGLSVLLGAVEDIILQGRRRGLGCTVISQRPALVHTNVRTQCETLIALRITAPHDLKAVREWVDVHATIEQAAEMMKSLPTLKVGEAWVWSPSFLDLFKRVRFRERETFDSSATPKVGKRVITPKVLAEIDLAALGAEIQATIEKTKADDPRELKRRIAALEKQLAATPKEQVEKVVQKIVEVPVLKNGQLDRTEKIADRLQALTEKFTAETQELRRLILAATVPRPWPTLRPAAQKPAAQKPVAPRTPAARTNPHGASSDLSKCERAILIALAQYGACPSAKLTLLTGYRYSGGFKNALSALRQRGYLAGANTEVMAITDDGLAAPGDFEPLPTGAALADYWMRHSSFGPCERGILLSLLNHPEGLEVQKLLELTGYNYSGGFKNALSNLRTAGVLIGRNTEVMRANDDLFD